MPRGTRFLAAALVLFGALLSPPSTRTARAVEAPDARDKALPCRPTIACTADIVPPGTFDVETGAQFRSLDPAGGASRQWTFPFLVKLTLADWVQVQVGSNGFTAARGAVPESFFDDAQLVAKFHLVDQSAWIPSISLSGEAGIPTVRAEGYVRTYDASFIAYITKDFGPLHADFNLAWNLWRVDASPLSQGLAALALSVNLPAPFGLMGEAYYFSNAAPIAPRDGGFLFAVSLSPRTWLIFDAGGDVGFFPSTRAYSVFIGASFIPAVLWRAPGR
ncbi:MAG TPA: hypothetical protein VH044_12580 [Polyangiaceae bacterium]|jgi:hypothetical protein|nr:hypothetical protein [Polyangiaceae bacterium]